MTEVNDDRFVFSSREAKVGELTTFQKLSILFFQEWLNQAEGLFPVPPRVF